MAEGQVRGTISEHYAEVLTRFFGTPLPEGEGTRDALQFIHSISAAQQPATVIETIRLPECRSTQHSTGIRL